MYWLNLIYFGIRQFNHSIDGFSVATNHQVNWLAMHFNEIIATKSNNSWFFILEKETGAATRCFHKKKTTFLILCRRKSLEIHRKITNHAICFNLLNQMDFCESDYDPISMVRPKKNTLCQKSSYSIKAKRYLPYSCAIHINFLGRIVAFPHY